MTWVAWGDGNPKPLELWKCRALKTAAIQRRRSDGGCRTFQAGGDLGLLVIFRWSLTDEPTFVETKRVKIVRLEEHKQQ